MAAASPAALPGVTIGAAAALPDSEAFFIVPGAAAVVFAARGVALGCRASAFAVRGTARESAAAALASAAVPWDSPVVPASAVPAASATAAIIPALIQCSVRFIRFSHAHATGTTVVVAATAPQAAPSILVQTRV